MEKNICWEILAGFSYSFGGCLGGLVEDVWKNLFCSCCFRIFVRRFFRLNIVCLGGRVVGFIQMLRLFE